MLMRAVFKALGVVYDVTEPVAGTCPVCAFWRGLGLGVLVTALVAYLAH